MEYIDGNPILAEDLENGQKKECCGKVAQMLKAITVEPVIFFSITAWGIQSSIGTDMLLTKVCREQLEDSEICANLSSYPKKEASVQKVVTTISLYGDLLTTIPTVLFILFLGSWSDKHGRKLPMILPLVGSFLASIINMINAYWIELPALYTLFAGVPIALSGGSITMFMACYSYMADITKSRARTMRIALMDIGFACGSPLGFFLSGVLFRKFGYLGNYGIGGLFFLFAIIYAIVRIEDTREPSLNCNVNNCELANRSQNMCKDLFDVKNVKDTFAVIIKPRPNKGRAKILLLMGGMCIMLIVFGSRNKDYLYAKLKFAWDYSQYMHLKLVGKLTSLAAMAVVPPLLSYWLQVHDSTLGIVGCVSEVFRHILEGLAFYPWFLYLGCVISSVGGLAVVVTRSIISKLVLPEELGKVFSMLAFWESILPLVSHPMYTFVYNTTIEDFPGAIYFLSTFLFVIDTIIFIWIYFSRRNESVPYHVHRNQTSDTEEK